MAQTRPRSDPSRPAGVVAVSRAQRFQPPPPPDPPNARRTGLIVLGLLLAIPLAWLVAVLVVRQTHKDAVLPGVRVDGVQLGGLSREDARDKLTDAVIGRTVTLTIAGKPYKVAPAEVGFRYDVDQTVERALDSGRTGRASGLVSTLTGVVATRDVTPVRAYDLTRLNARAREIARSTERDGSFGAIKIDPGGLQAEPVDPQPGRTVDTQTVATALREALRTGRTDVVVPVERVRTVTPAAVTAVADAATAYLGAPLKLTGAGKPALLQPRDVGTFLALERSKGSSGVRLGVDPTALAKALMGVAGSRDRAGTSARVSVPLGSTQLTEQGSVSFRPKPAAGVRVRGGTTGRQIEQTKAVTAIAAAVRAGEHEVALPVKKVPPPVSVTAARKVDELIGTFTTPFVGGQPRVKNITLAARAIDGTVVAPGAQFSLNDAVGERTTEKGYVKAPFIAEGNRLEDSVGGGVSQLSTTTYNAAYFAGLQIDTHTPHSFYIGRYPAGRESTLNFGSIDLKWTNDTAVPVVIRTSVGPSSITVALYGDNGGRRVRSEVGDREGEGGGFSITVTRHTTYADGHTKDEPYTTKYDAAPAGE